MQVLLINPNRCRPHVPPIGLEYVCNSLERTGISFEVADLNFISEAALVRKCERTPFGMIGITIRNIDNTSLIDNQYFLPPIKKMIRRLKRIRPCPVVVGGSGYSQGPKEVLEYLGADFGVVGFGEQALPQLIAALERGGGLGEVENLVWKDNGTIRLNPLSTRGFAAVPPRKRSFVRNAEYYRVYRMANIETRRGCTMACGFCCEPNFVGNEIVARGIDNVLAEMKDLADQGLTNLSFVDSEFNLGDRHYLWELCRRISAEKLNLTWTTSFYPERGFPLELFHSMYAAGCRELALSVDSGAEGLLRSMGKKHTAEDVIVNSENIKKAGISLMHYYLVGWPGESFATIDETVNLIAKTQPDMSVFFVGIRIAPQTPLARLAAAEGVITAEADLCRPTFYNARHVLQVFYPYLRKRLRKTPNCVLPSRWWDLKHQMIHRVVQRGYDGTIAKVDQHFRSLPVLERLAILFAALADTLFPGRSLFRQDR